MWNSEVGSVEVRERLFLHMRSLPFIAKEGSFVLYVSNVGLITHIYSHGVLLWSLEKHLPVVALSIFHHGEIAQMLVYQMYVGGEACYGRNTVYEVVVYAWQDKIYIVSTSFMTSLWAENVVPYYRQQ